jgi:hypothetical protein
LKFPLENPQKSIWKMKNCLIWCRNFPTVLNVKNQPRDWKTSAGIFRIYKLWCDSVFWEYQIQGTIGGK